MKTEIAMNMTLSKGLGLPAKKAGKLEMHIETSYVVKFSGFDKRVKIVLPEDARKAATFQVFRQFNKNFTSTA